MATRDRPRQRVRLTFSLPGGLLFEPSGGPAPPATRSQARSRGWAHLVYGVATDVAWRAARLALA